MTVFPTAGHLASWAGICPGNNSSGGKRRPGRTRHGSMWLRIALTEAAQVAARGKGTYLAAHHAQIRGRRGTQKAIGATRHDILIVLGGHLPGQQLLGRGAGNTAGNHPNTETLCHDEGSTEPGQQDRVCTAGSEAALISLLLEEYRSLRAEASTRISMKAQILGLGSAAAALLAATAGFSAKAPNLYAGIVILVLALVGWRLANQSILRLGGLFRTSEDYFRTRRVAIGDGPLSGRIGFAYSTYRKRTVERVLYHRVLSL